MTPHEAEIDARIFSTLGRAIKSLAPIDAMPGATDDRRVAAGLAVYRNNVRAAFLRVLQDTFPVVERLVGEEFFRYVAHEYFFTCPASGPLVARYADAMPEFIAAFDPAKGLPYLADVARLELAWLGAYHAAEANSLSPEEILKAVGEAADRARFIMHPSFRLVSSIHPIHAIWLHNKQSRSDRLSLPEGGQHVLLVRPAHEVVCSVVEPGVAAALDALSGGAIFGEALLAAADRAPETPLSEIVQRIATSGVISAVADKHDE